VTYCTIIFFCFTYYLRITLIREAGKPAHYHRADF
jgi:hypothetical protein